MRRLCLMVSVAASVALVGCGNATDTVTLTSNGQTLSLVISGSSDQIQSLASNVNTAVSQGESTAGVTVATASGDQHHGAMVCATDVSRNGESFHIIVYSTESTVTSTVCTSIDALGS